MSITGTVTQVAPGQMPSQATMPMNAADAQGGAKCSDKRFRERVDSALADFYLVCFGRQYTGAWWLTRAVYVSGDASDAATAELQLQVYRSVRFAGAPRP